MSSKTTRKFIAVVIVLGLIVSVAPVSFAAQDNSLLGEQTVSQVQQLSMPTELCAQAVDGTSVALSWKQPQDTGELTVAGYCVFRATAGSDVYEQIAECSGSTQYVDEGLMPGTQYSYKVAAYHIDQQRVMGKETEAVSVTLDHALFGPPANLQASSYGFNQVQLDWEPGELAEGYHIYRSEHENFMYTFVEELAGANTTSFVDTSELIAGKTYYYKLASYRYVNQKRVESEHTQPVHATAGTAELGNPEDFTAENDIGWSVRLRWTPAQATEGYHIYRSEYESFMYELVAQLDGAHTSQYVDHALGQSSKRYYYKIASYQATSTGKLEGEMVGPVSVVTEYSPLHTPDDIRVEPRESSLLLQWNMVARADGYELYRAKEKDGSFVKIQDISKPTITSYEDKGLAAGSLYYYKMRAYAVANQQKIYSAQSDVAIGYVTGDTLAAPSKPKARSYSIDQAKISWEAVEGADGYHILGSNTKDGTYRLLHRVESGSATEWIRGKMVPGQNYYYKIQAYKTVRNHSVPGELSEVFAGRTQVSRPAGFGARGKDTQSIELSWRQPRGADGYLIYRSERQDKGYTQIKLLEGGKTTSYTDRADLQAATKYYYKVRPYCVVNNARVGGATTGVVVGQTRTDGVTGVRAQCSAYNELTVSWNRKAGAHAYQVFYSKTENSGYVRAGSTGANRLSIRVEPEQPYYIKVRHYEREGNTITYGTFSLPIRMSAEHAAPELYVTMDNTPISETTSFAVLLRNGGHRPLIFRSKDAKLRDPRDLSNRCRLAVYGASGKRLSRLALAEDRSGFLLFSNRRGFPYHEETAVEFQFFYDGAWYRCTANSREASYRRL